MTVSLVVSTSRVMLTCPCAPVCSVIVKGLPPTRRRGVTVIRSGRMVRRVRLIAVPQDA
jgi:hypothetical protein